MERSHFFSTKIKAWLFFLTIFSTATVIHSAKAQSSSNPAKINYPTSTIRIVVPVAAGGATDVIARAIAPRLTASLNQQVIVDNRVGGGSNIGFESVAKAQPDGYTLLLAQPAFTVNVSLYKKLAYDPIRDFSPITLAVRGENVLVVHPSVPARNLQEFIKLAKSKPGQLNFGSSGNGTTPHLSGELLKSMAGINIVHVPYKGASAAISEVMGGHIDMAFVSTSSVIAQINSGRMRG
jgi:tripartite-type tricarboxylate transporter receptor subunit TctC